MGHRAPFQRRTSENAGVPEEDPRKCWGRESVVEPKKVSQSTDLLVEMVMTKYTSCSCCDPGKESSC